MNTEQKLKIAREALEVQQRNILELEKQLELEQSFGTPETVYMVVRRSIDTGRLEGTLGVFESKVIATQFAIAKSQVGYGFGHDIFVEPVDMYLGRV